MHFPSQLRRLRPRASTAAFVTAGLFLLDGARLQAASQVTPQNAPAAQTAESVKGVGAQNGGDARNTPTAVPAGVTTSLPPGLSATPLRPSVTHKQAREAEAAYTAGARAIEHKDLQAAERAFTEAARLNPARQEYALALIVAREHRVTELVQEAAKARLSGNEQKAETLLNQARLLDPDNAVVLQHFGPAGLLPVSSSSLPFPSRTHHSEELGGAPELAPAAGRQSFRQSSIGPQVLQAVYAAFGIRAVIDPSVKATTLVRFNLENVDFATAVEVLASMTHTFAVPLDNRSVLIADDSPENRSRLEPQVEETIFLPGTSAETLNELATLARSVFDIKQVVASPGSSTLLVRGESATLRLLNGTYDTMLGGGADVLLDLKLYELDRSRTRNIGAVLPSSAGAFSIASQAQQLVSANQTLVNQAIAQGVITLTGNSLTDLVREVGFLIATGTVSSTQYTNLLGILGGGLTLTGVYLGSNASFNLLLNSSDVRLLDAVQLRAGDRLPSSFRVGTRYPVVTSTYSSGLPSSVTSAAAGLSVNGTSVSSLLSGLGLNSISVPQVQFEDLGLTLKTTPKVLRDNSVMLQLDLKLEALGGGTINNIPILNSRALTSSVTIPAGSTALLVSQMSTSETRSLQGLPGLNDLPGFGGTDRNSQKDTAELLITLTPRVVRRGDLQIVSRPIPVPRSARTTVD